MNWIREIVSGKKQRFKEDGYNLDLTYVTPRIIAMSFPATGFESTYRNSIDDVVRLIRGKHNKNYMVFNLSGRKYDYLKLDGQVVEYPWEDHHSPPLHFLFNICEDIHKFLSNPKGKNASAVAIHCLAGKGRTGTVICCYLMYCGAFTNADDALYYYKKKRFLVGGGVTQPSQVRYVKYFEKLFFGGPLKVKAFSLNGVSFNGINDVASLRPSIKIYEVKKSKDSQEDLLLYPSKETENDKSIVYTDPANNRFVFQAPPNLFLHGDFLVRVYNQQTFSDKLMFRFALNSAFFPDDQDKTIFVKCYLSDMDPDKVSKDPRFQRDFFVELSLSPIESPVKEVADAIKEEQIYMDWIGKICKQYVKPTPEATKLLLFGPEKNDIEVILKDKTEEVAKFASEKFQKADAGDISDDDEEEEKKVDNEVNRTYNYHTEQKNGVNGNNFQPEMIISEREYIPDERPGRINYKS